MLVLTRTVDEEITIGNDIRVMIVGVDRHSGKVRLGVTAPDEIGVHRREVYDAIMAQGRNPGITHRLLPVVVDGQPKATDHELEVVNGNYQI